MNTNPQLLPISVIIITPSAAELNWSKLKHLSWAGEILLVVTSSDEAGLPVSISKRLQALIRMVHTGPISNFAQTRNAALQFAKYDWVLFLDSDEWLEPLAVSDLTPLIENPSIAWSFQRRDYFLNQPLRYGEPGKSRVIRLFHRAKTRYVGQVHETPQVAGSIAQTSIVIHHAPHQSVASFWQKISWYARLAAQERSDTLLATIWQLLTYPVLKWLVNFILLRGFLDGWRGLLYATMMSYHSLMVRMYRIEALLDPSDATTTPQPEVRT